jgi:hypothetical protein
LSHAREPGKLLRSPDLHLDRAEPQNPPNYANLATIPRSPTSFLFRIARDHHSGSSKPALLTRGKVKVVRGWRRKWTFKTKERLPVVADAHNGPMI